MDEIKDINHMAFEAEKALIMYRLVDHNQKPEDHREYYHCTTRPPSRYMTIHSIRNGQICEGSPVTRKKLTKFCKSVIPAIRTEPVFFPDNLLTYTPLNTVMLWWYPSAIRHLYFEKKMGIPCGKAPVPALVFRYSGIGLSTFALAEDVRPSLKTKIYRSPFHNWGCMGNVPLPANPTPEDTDSLAALFWRSSFSGHNPPELNGTTPEKLWKGLVNSGRKTFPTECLVETGHLGDLFGRNADDY